MMRMFMTVSTAAFALVSALALTACRDDPQIMALNHQRMKCVLDGCTQPDSLMLRSAVGALDLRDEENPQISDFKGDFEIPRIFTFLVPDELADALLGLSVDSNLDKSFVMGRNRTNGRGTMASAVIVVRCTVNALPMQKHPTFKKPGLKAMTATEKCDEDGRFGVQLMAIYDDKSPKSVAYSIVFGYFDDSVGFVPMVNTLPVKHGLK